MRNITNMYEKEIEIELREVEENNKKNEINQNFLRSAVISISLIIMIISDRNFLWIDLFVIVLLFIFFFKKMGNPYFVSFAVMKKVFESSNFLKNIEAQVLKVDSQGYKVIEKYKLYNNCNIDNFENRIHVEQQTGNIDIFDVYEDANTKKEIRKSVGVVVCINNKYPSIGREFIESRINNPKRIKELLSQGMILITIWIIQNHTIVYHLTGVLLFWIFKNIGSIIGVMIMVFLIVPIMNKLGPAKYEEKTYLKNLLGNAASRFQKKTKTGIAKIDEEVLEVVKIAEKFGYRNIKTIVNSQGIKIFIEGRTLFNKKFKKNGELNIMEIERDVEYIEELIAFSKRVQKITELNNEKNS